MKIRRFKTKDANQVSIIVCRNFLEVNIRDYSYEKMQKLSQLYTPKKIINISENGHTYVAYIENEIIGCATIAPYFNKINESIILTVFVIPEYHGQNVGRRLIKQLEQDEFFIRSKRIEIPASITAAPFYEKMGYTYKNNLKVLDEEGHYRMEKFNI